MQIGLWIAVVEFIYTFALLKLDKRWSIASLCVYTTVEECEEL